LGNNGEREAAGLSTLGTLGFTGTAEIGRSILTTPGVPPEPKMEDPLKVSDIDKINQNSPFQPVFFAYDMAEIDSAAPARPFCAIL